MDFGDEWAGGVDDLHVAVLGFLTDRGGYSMRAKNHVAALRGFLETVDKNDALLFKVFDDSAVMHDFLAHINGMRKFLQRNIDDINRPNNSRTKPTRPD